MAHLLIDYPSLVRGAMNEVVRSVLERVAEEGLPGEHHFYLTFQTTGPGVEMPAILRQAHPEEMTIVLQHQFRDLHVDAEAFEVTLLFSGQPRRLRVPYSALTTFVDPAAEFGLQLAVNRAEAESQGVDSEVPGNGETDETTDNAQILSFDRSKKRDT